MSEKKVDRLTVLILATTFPRWGEDTIPQFIYELSKEITKEDFETIVLAPHHHGAKRKETMSGVTVYRYPYFLPKKYQSLCYDGGIIESIKNNPLSLIQVPFLLVSLVVHTLLITKKENIDVINSHWLVPNGLVGAMVSSVMDIPHVLTLHAGGVLGLQKIKFHQKISTFVNNRTDMVLPVSSHIYDNFTEMLQGNTTPTEDRFQIQPMGAHIQNYEVFSKDERVTEKEDNEFKLLFVGRLAEKKGIKYLLDSVKMLESQLDDSFCLTIVGTGPLEDELHAYMAEKGVGDYVEFTGWVSDDELRHHYTSSDCVVVPSIETASGDTEGMPTVIAEAFAAGNPVIATNVGGIPDVVIDGENGYIVEQQDPNALADCIQQLIDNSHLKQELATKAAEAAEKLDWKQCGKTYRSVFHSVHKSKNSRS